MPEEWYDKARFYRRFCFRFGDCDLNKTASLHAVMKLFSEMAGEDYEGRGLGHTILWEHGQAFLLSRMSLRFHRKPRYSEQTIAVTWERFSKGVFFYRDYEIRNESGELLISGTSLWFLINPLSREVLRPNMILGGIRTGDPETADCAPCKKVPRNNSLPILGSRPIYFSDIDANGHVNNAVYGKIADDFLPDDYRKRGVRDVFIEFKTETVKGDTLLIKGAPTENGFIVQGMSGEMYAFGVEFVF